MGQTGNASISRNEFNHALPVPDSIIVPGLSSGILSIGAGGYHSCAVIQGAAAGDGASAVCWGKNDKGQLGTGSTSPTFSISPLPVAGLGSGVASLAAGFQHSCARMINGSVCCWGSNDHGQLGLGFFSNANSPVTFPTLVAGLPPGIVQVVVGGYHTCALASDGSVLCWGRCLEAQMGDNSPPCTDVDGKPSPTQVSGLGAGSGVVKISAGNLHSCGVMSNGSVVCWGGEPPPALLSHGSQFRSPDDSQAQLGQDTRVTSTSSLRRVPDFVLGISDAVAITCGFCHTCALRSTGQPVCWGCNTAGY